ncbi:MULTISPECIES: dTDP-4-dehydrorhamnose 3,5-epimerase [unclassified Pandoraea]|uniref:dTDP-4-dehydrorhamnose 3,5-epimerase n=1 Tax=unclassified Pandoraea TaxID=2624094 RepID=UPI000B40167D|nr:MULTISPECIES: dTDP-4-dehydrorhamnose 3,5-epimerase [unclassified Pandoraea]
MDEVIQLASGAIVTPLKRIEHPKGDVLHGLKATDDTFRGFGEAYFSTVLPGITKGWKRHERMTLNLVVPVGTIEFHLRSLDGQIADSIRLGETRYARLTVPPGVWMAFTGIGASLNLLLNVASIPHDPTEAVNVPLEHFSLES